jgi:4-hydroxybenzoate polyprenyltransferase
VFILSGRKATALFLSWQLWISFCYVWPKMNHWIFRNAFSGVGNFIMFRLSDAIISKEVPSLQTKPYLDFLFALWIMVTIHLQEFHDMNGDKLSGRRTLPLALSASSGVWLRRATATILIISAGIITGLAMTDFRDGCYNKLVFLCSCYAVGATSVGMRTLLSDSREMDEKTYKVYYFCAAYALVICLAFFNTYI